MGPITVPQNSESYMDNKVNTRNMSFEPSIPQEAACVWRMIIRISDFTLSTKDTILKFAFTHIYLALR